MVLSIAILTMLFVVNRTFGDKNSCPLFRPPPTHSVIHLLFRHQEICHRDLKLENTLLDGSPVPRVKICDFGYSKVSDI